MLSYISSKFSSGPRPSLHEARAAIFLNRFTRTLTIMYATNGLEALLGIPATELQGKSFYYCIQENCLPEAVRCLESAKANDSIAYLRFWFRDPRDQPAGDEDENMSDAQSSDQDDDEGGGVRLGGDAMDTDSGDQMVNSASSNSGSVNRHRPSPSSSATNGSNTSPAAIFDQPYPAPESSTTSVFRTDRSPLARRTAAAGPLRQVELEAVVSCTSDGLVVILRKARPFVLDTLRPPVYQNGLFAAPWGTRPIIPDTPSPLSIPIDAQGYPAPINAPGAPSEDFMNSIREVAVFAWALTGINGSLAQYSRGNPQPGAQPYSGLPIWAPGVDEPDGAVANGSSYVHCKDPKKVEL